MDLKDLKKQFPADDIEWRIGRAGEKDGSIWATCLAYVTNRAIMDRLDEVCGEGNWKNEFAQAPDGGVLCGISIKVPTATGTEWVTKWDGADNTNIEAVKGGLSGAMKRAGVQWGIGRYLYDLTESKAIINKDGEHYAPASYDKSGKQKCPAFKWDNPKLPAWALPVPKEREGIDSIMAEATAILKAVELPKDKRTELGKKFKTVKTIEDAIAFKAEAEKTAGTVELVKLTFKGSEQKDVLFEDDEIPFEKTIY